MRNFSVELLHRRLHGNISKSLKQLSNVAHNFFKCAKLLFSCLFVPYVPYMLLCLVCSCILHTLPIYIAYIPPCLACLWVLLSVYVLCSILALRVFMVLLPMSLLTLNKVQFKHPCLVWRFRELTLLIKSNFMIRLWQPLQI